MIAFEFSTPTRIVFGRGAVDGIAALTRGLGRRALVVHGRSARRAGRVTAPLKSSGIETTTFAVAGEPDTVAVMAGAAAARASGAEFVIGVGGGSAIDAAKAIAGLATNGGDVLDYLEVVGRGQPLRTAALPSVAVPTTAGTGSEVTRNAVLASPAHRVKVSLRSPFLAPHLAIVDPALTVELPPALTASTGLDALTQLIEAYVSCRATPMTDLLCEEGIRRAAVALRRAFHDGGDRDARADMALASLWSGMALANAGLGAVHGLAGAIGGRFQAPHGAICAALLPHVSAVNLQALETRAVDHPARARYAAVAHWLTGTPTAAGGDGVAWLRDLVAELQIPRLSAYGVAGGHVDELVAQALRASSTKGNPLELSREELSAALAEAV